jgi:hypothetical protein
MPRVGAQYLNTLQQQQQPRIRRRDTPGSGHGLCTGACICGRSSQQPAASSNSDSAGRRRTHYHCSSSTPSFTSASRWGVRVRLFAQPTSLWPRSCAGSGSGRTVRAAHTTSAAWPAAALACSCRRGQDRGLLRARQGEAGPVHTSARMNSRLGLLEGAAWAAPSNSGSSGSSIIERPPANFLHRCRPSQLHNCP